MAGEVSPFLVGSSGGCGFGVVVAFVVDAVPTISAVVAFPSILGFAPPFPPLPLAPFGGDDLRDEDEFAVKYLYLFPFPSPPPPDLEEKNEKARTCCCAACVIVDAEIAAAGEASETAGRAATSRANICKEIQGARWKVCGSDSGAPHPLSCTGFQKRNASHGHNSNAIHRVLHNRSRVDNIQ